MVATTNTTPNSKQFSFCAYDTDCMMENFSDGFIVDVHMRYGSSDIIFDVSVCDDKIM